MTSALLHDAPADRPARRGRWRGAARYSSLRALQRLPFDVVKIDRSFVADLHRSEQEAAIVASVISLAHALGKRTVAEGIEAVAQVERLRSLGCDVGQGFHYARPCPVEQLGYGL